MRSRIVNVALEYKTTQNQKRSKAMYLQSHLTFSIDYNCAHRWTYPLSCW